MWTKIFVLIAVTTTGVTINGLQNDLDIGYPYNHPHKSLSPAVEASLALYVNIAANRDAEQHFYVVPTPDFGGNLANHGLRQISPLPQNHNINAVTPFNQQGTNFRPSYPDQNYPRGPQFTHQTNARNSAQNTLHPHQRGGCIIQKLVVENVQQSSFNNFADQTYQRSPTLSPQITPQPYTPHVTVQIDPKTHQGSSEKQYRLVTSMASLPMSYNAQLPFPIGVVPIKFRPLPLKTNLRQGLLPLTSYQAGGT